MNTITNRFGELQTDWQSHKHPDNADFMQVVKFMHIQYADGRSHLYWSLANSSANDKHVIHNITLAEAQALYCDAEIQAICEEDFQQWLKSKTN